MFPSLSKSMDVMKSLTDEYSALDPTTSPNPGKKNTIGKLSNTDKSSPLITMTSKEKSPSPEKKTEKQDKVALKTPTKPKEPLTKSDKKPSTKEKSVKSPKLLEEVTTSETSGIFEVKILSEFAQVTAAFPNEDRTSKIEINFKLPLEQVKSDCSLPLTFPLDEMISAQRAAVDKLTFSDAKVTTAVKNNAFHLESKGKNKESVSHATKIAWERAKEVRSTFISDYMYHERSVNNIAPDYARLFLYYASLLTNVKEALMNSLIIDPSCMPSVRSFATRALYFVQSIPYERAEGGFRRPFSVLTDFRGNCGSKTCLFLSILKNAYPSLDMLPINVPNHVRCGVKLDEVIEGDELYGDEKLFVLMEPVGPGRLPLGRFKEMN